MTPGPWVEDPETLAALLLLWTLGFTGAWAATRALGLQMPTLSVDRAVARHILDLVEETGWHEDRRHGVNLRIDRVLDGQLWVVRYRGEHTREGLLTREQAEDEIVSWRRGAW